jgi:cytochrome c biogenesis protein CcdA
MRLSKARSRMVPFYHSCLASPQALLWVPCVGPMLGLILTCAALKAQVSAGRRYSFYAAGAATSLALALADGGRLLASMK